MKKKILLIIFTVLCVFSLCGCSILSQNGNSEASNAVKGFLNAIKKDDAIAAKSYLLKPDEFESLASASKTLGLSDEITQKFVDKYTNISFSIEDTKKAEQTNKAIVIVTLTVPDYSASFNSALSSISENMTNEQAFIHIIETMANSNPEQITKSAAVYVVKNGENWLIDYQNNNYELHNAINGNILSVLHGYMDV